MINKSDKENILDKFKNQGLIDLYNMKKELKNKK